MNEINANKFQNVEPQNIGLWTYESDDVILNFEDGLLYARSDPRTRLNDILLFYGTPHSIIWQVPVQNFHGAIYATYLTYPEHNAVFFTWEKVVNFTADTEFSDSNISTQENFEAILSNFVTDDFNHYEHSPWLCDS